MSLTKIRLLTADNGGAPEMELKIPKAASFLEGVAGNLPKNVTPNYSSEPLTITPCGRDGRCGQLHDVTPFEDPAAIPCGRIAENLCEFDLLALLSL